MSELEYFPAVRTVLMADDDPAIRQLVQHHLEKHGFKVLTAVNGGAALATIKAEQPDLVILDIEMPEMNGLEVLRRIRGEASTAHLPVVLLTARDNLNDIITATRAGADAYIPKPFRLHRLLEAVEKGLEDALMDHSATDGEDRSSRTARPSLFAPRDPQFPAR